VPRRGDCPVDESSDVLPRVSIEPRDEIDIMIGARERRERYWFSGGNKFVSGAAFSSTGEYDPRTKTWQQTDSHTWGNKLSSAWDPFHLRVLLRDYFDLWQYNPLAAAGRKYTQLTREQIPKAPEDFAGSAIFDKQRHRYLVHCPVNSGPTYRWRG